MCDYPLRVVQIMIKNNLQKTELTTKDFGYHLPEELIAQSPSDRRDNSRLMVIHRDSGQLDHRIFHEIVDYIRPEDVLVVNDSKVFPARLIGTKEGGAAVVEILLLRQVETTDAVSASARSVWECIVRPGKHFKVDAKFVFGEGLLTATVKEIKEDGNRLVEFDFDGVDFFAVLDKVGTTPLPPYIKEQEKADIERYQTVYARESGSAAAPTAGLHFTPELLDKIRAQGTAIVPVTLHIGLGTFRPVKTERVEDHEMHGEYFTVTAEAAELINTRRGAGGRIIAVGTTSCRVLESASDDDGILHPIAGETGIFIYPGYTYKAVDGMITNFHLPESTLVMMVSAFYSREGILSAYQAAVEEKYRFFSFGDATLML